MRRRDRHKPPVPATLIQPLPDETFQQRHARRLQTNLAGEAELRSWADENGIVFEIKNNGHHWIFKKPGFLAEWWPSSAKLVIAKRWNHGIHCHDWKQVQVVLAGQVKTDVELARLKAIEARALDLFAKAQRLDEEFSSDAGNEVANAIEYVLGKCDAQHCGILNMAADLEPERAAS
jgi:hypothetical protein